MYKLIVYTFNADNSEHTVLIEFYERYNDLITMAEYADRLGYKIDVQVVDNE